MKTFDEKITQVKSQSCDSFYTILKDLSARLENPKVYKDKTALLRTFIETMDDFMVSEAVYKSNLQFLESEQAYYNKLNGDEKELYKRLKD